MIRPRLRELWTVVLLLIVSGCDHPERFLVAGNRAYQRGDRQAALTSYQQAYRHESTRISASLNMGRLLMEAGDAKSAEPFLDQGLTGRPDYAPGRLYRGQAKLALGKPMEAEHDFEKAVAIDPGTSAAWIELAKLRAARGEWSSAQQALNACIADSTVTAEATFLAVDYDRRAGHPGRGLARLEALIASQPELAQGYLTLGALLLELKNPPEAERRLRAGLQLQPGDRAGQLNLALSLRAMGQSQAAAAVFREIVDSATAPDDPLAIQARDHLARKHP